MSSVKIVTDSSSDIPKRMREQLGIELVPLKVTIGEDLYLDGVSDSGEFYEKLKASPEPPRTSQPSPAEFSEVYGRILKQHPDASILSFHLASVLSGTCQSAMLGASMLETDADITVVDSKSASYGFGAFVVKAAEMAAAGSAKEDILEAFEQFRLDRKLYFLVDTLEYLQKGGRIGKAAALLGTILNIKPILTLSEEGEVFPVDKVRGQKKAMARIVELLKRDFGRDPVDMTVGWAYRSELALELAGLAQAELNVRTVRQTEIGAAIGTHAGPGTAALFMNRV
ncbi:DegV family protein [Paenibacillus humicola]|uniref:DegV family protein n=1 Tax=Paenibacillus humicola TaxID=3110540 RepID=UPI00237BBF57|nr:DegV family protein [Paenibacillus humicola]